MYKMSWASHERVLLGACQNGSLDTLAELIDGGIDINRETSYGNTALFTAVQFEEYELVKFLLKKGVNPNWVNAQGVTVIHYLSSEQMLKILIDGQLNVHLEEHGVNPPLFYLARNEQVDMVQALIKEKVQYQHLDFDAVTDSKVRREIRQFISCYEACEEKKILDNNVSQVISKTSLKI